MKNGNIVLLLVVFFLLTISVTSVTAQKDAKVIIHYDVFQSGIIYGNSPSQIIPASYLIFEVRSIAFPDASAESPVIIQIDLPADTFLTRTLATGEQSTSAPLPSNEEVVPDLAVLEYAVNKKGLVLAVPPSEELSDIGPHAVQLFRCVAGERRIQIRFTESPQDWTPSEPYHFIGFSLFIGGGVWPPDEESNLGPEGVHSQPSTLLHMDLRQFDYEHNEYHFPVTTASFYQYTLVDTGTEIVPYIFNLFEIEEVITDETSVSSTVGGEVTDFTVADLNGDARDDVISIDENANRLYWVFAYPDGTFQDLDWRETVGITPVTIDAADISGDSRPDILIGDSSGNLIVYFWEDLFLKEAGTTKVSRPSILLKMPGLPSDSTVNDIDRDGRIDYLFVDETDNTLTVLFGDAFTVSQSYPTGEMPAALAAGDFNGDGFLDVAVANYDSDSVSIFRNDGLGAFTVSQLQDVGSEPVDIDTADFDRNGKTDIVYALAEGKAISMILAQPDGHFDPETAQMIYFVNTPSAILADNFDGRNGPDVLLGYSDYHKLSLCTSNESGILSFSYEINTLGDVVVDPSNNVILSEDNILSVAGGTGFGGVSSREGVAAIIAQEYNVVHFLRSYNISFSMVNRGDGPALLNLELYDDEGIFQSSSTQSIAVNAQFARYFTDLLGPEAANPNHWVRAFLTESETFGLWLVNEFSQDVYLDGTKVPNIRDAMSRFIFTAVQMENGSSTELYLINPNRVQAHITLEARDRFGNIKDTCSVLLNSRGRKTLDALVAFPTLVNGDYIFVGSDQPVFGIEVFGTSRSVACLRGVPVGLDQQTLYCPHVAQGDLGADYESVLTIVNTGDEGVVLTLWLMDDDGLVMATLPGLPVSPGGKQERKLTELFNLAEPYSGYLLIETDGHTGLVGHITFNDAAGGNFYSALPLQSAVHDTFIMGHIANGTVDSIGYFTGIAIVNPKPDPINVGVTAYDQTGLWLDSKNLSVGDGDRAIFILDDLMPDLMDIFGGYIIIQNRNPGSGLLVFQLFGDANLQFLSVVPAIPMD